MQNMASMDPEFARLGDCAIIESLSDAMRILHACNPNSPVVAITLASLGEFLRQKRGSPGREPMRETPGQLDMPSACETIWQMRACQGRYYSPSQRLEQTIKLLDHLQSTRLPTLVQLSVYVVRDVLAGPIEVNVDALLKWELDEEKRCQLRSRILLEDILCSNSVRRVQEADESVDDLFSATSRFSVFHWANRTARLSLYGAPIFASSSK